MVSEIHKKMPTGIEGFDEISNGGLPQGRTTLLVGGPGSGKTVFALNLLVNGARMYGEPGIFVAFEENTQQIFANAASFGWDLPELVDRNLFFIDARLSSDATKTGGFDLKGLLAGIEAKAQEMATTAAGQGAQVYSPVRIVFDSLDVLLAHLQDPMAEREEIYRIHDWLAHNKFSGIITSKDYSSFENLGNHSITLQYMADCVIHLDRQVVQSISERTLTIVKYRGSSFAENVVNMVIGQHGIEVPSLNIHNLDYSVTQERVSSGIEALDSMLAGGYLRGSSTLITGSPGTAKSTLAAAFIDTTCRRGERGLYISFDEGSEEIIRNMNSIGLHLRQHIETGLLRIYPSRADALGPVDHLVRIQAQVRENNPTCIVIDPLSAMVKAGGERMAKTMAQRLIYETKAAGVTLLMTSLLSENDPTIEGTPLEISTIADTWIHLSYVILAGERNRALTIIKARGTPHSNQVRELILSSQGMRLAHLYTSGSEVLMGTLRYEKETQEREKARQREVEVARRQRELELRHSEAKARMESIQREIETTEEELAFLADETARQKKQLQENQDGIQQRRSGSEPDEESPN